MKSFSKLSWAVGFALMSTACMEGMDAPPAGEADGPTPLVIKQANMMNAVSKEVPGNWTLPPDVAAKVSGHRVQVVDPPATNGSCSSSNPFQCSCRHPVCGGTYPGRVSLRDFILTNFKGLTFGGGYCCRQNTSKLSHLSVHATGRAIDIMVPMIGGTRANNGLGDVLANWLVENAEFIGVQRVIWDGSFWNGQRGMGTLTKNFHRNHIHIEITPQGAAGQTPFFTRGAVVNDKTCDPGCAGSRVVREDCSYVDCNINNTECLDGPPARCSDPPPPEPPEAEKNTSPRMLAVKPLGKPLRFNFQQPRRLFDTREETKSTLLKRGNGSTKGKLTVMQPNVYEDENASFPPNTKAIWINVAATQADEAGFIAVHTAGQPQPDPSTSTINYVPDFARANAVPVYLGPKNGFALHSIRTTHAVADLYGAFTTTDGLGLTPVVPTRVIDTRSTNSPLTGDSKVDEFTITLPEGTEGVVASVAVVDADQQGFIQMIGCGDPAPGNTSNINFTTNDAVANTVVVKVGSDGKLCVKSTTKANLIIDITGYLSDKGKLGYQPVEPVRILDTRDDDSLYTNRLAKRQVIEIPINDIKGLPEAAWSAAVNITAVTAASDGFITAFPCEAGIPNTSSVNYTATSASGALSFAPLGPSGKLCLMSSTRAHVVVDLLGAWIHSEKVTAPMPVSTPPVEDNADEDGGGEDNNLGTGGTGEKVDRPPHQTNYQGDTLPPFTPFVPGGGRGTSTTTTGMPTTGSDMGTNTNNSNSSELTGNTSRDEGGCQSTRATNAGDTPLGLMLLLGFLGWTRRRRRQA